MFTDPFHFFRWVLTIFVTVYATIVTVQLAWSYYIWLTIPDRYMAMLRHYVILHSLRLRIRRFAGDALVCLGLTVALSLMVVAQWRLDGLQATLERIPSDHRSDHMTSAEVRSEKHVQPR